MSGVYEERLGVREKDLNYVHKIALNRREISSLELHSKWNNGCALKVHMNDGRLYKSTGNCEELEELYDAIRNDMDYQYPGTFEFRT